MLNFKSVSKNKKSILNCIYFLFFFIIASCFNYNSRNSIKIPIKKPRSKSIRCVKPAPEILTPEIEAKLIASLKKFKYIAKTSMSLNRKVQKIREVLPGLQSFEVLEYRFCTMYANGVITQKQYYELIEKVFPLVFEYHHDVELEKIWNQLKELNRQIKLFNLHTVFNAYQELNNIKNSIKNNQLKDPRLIARTHRIMAGIYLASNTCCVPYNPRIHKAYEKNTIDTISDLCMNALDKTANELEKSLRLDKRQVDSYKLENAIHILKDNSMSLKDLKDLWILLIDSETETSNSADRLHKILMYLNEDPNALKAIEGMGIPLSPYFKKKMFKQ